MDNTRFNKKRREPRNISNKGEKGHEHLGEFNRKPLEGLTQGRKDEIQTGEIYCAFNKKRKVDAAPSLIGLYAKKNKQEKKHKSVIDKEGTTQTDSRGDEIKGTRLSGNGRSMPKQTQGERS